MEAAEHAVADRHPGDVLARREDGADELVADREAGLDLHAAVVDVQVRAADAARLDRDDRVRRGPATRARGAPVDADFPGAWKVTALIVFMTVAEEALPGLAPEPPGPRQPPQQRRGAVALLPPLVEQRVEHAEHVIEPDLIGPAKRTARVVQPEHHASVDVLGAADPFSERERGLVDDLADDPAEHESRRVADPCRSCLPSVVKKRSAARAAAPVLSRSSGQLDDARLAERRQRVKPDRATGGVERRERAGGATDRLGSAL